MNSDAGGGGEAFKTRRQVRRRKWWWFLEEALITDSTEAAADSVGKLAEIQVTQIGSGQGSLRKSEDRALRAAALGRLRRSVLKFLYNFIKDFRG